MAEKIPPQNLEAEQSLIGSMLIDKDAVIAVSGWLLPEHFYDERNGIIYAGILELFNDALPIDLVTLSDLFKKKKQLAKIGGKTYLADLVAMVPTSAHAEEYGAIVKESATRRGLITASRDITELAFNESMKIDTVIDQSEKKIFDVAQSGTKSNFVHIKDLLKEAYERAERAENDEAYLGVSTGFKDLDDLLGGFQKSDLVILAARPSVGKTSLALDMMRHAAMVEKKKSGRASWRERV